MIDILAERFARNLDFSIRQTTLEAINQKTLPQSVQPLRGGSVDPREHPQATLPDAAGT